MHYTSRIRSAHRPLRASALLALLLLLGLVGLRPPPAALAACGGSTTIVGTAAELNAAITAFNDIDTACAFTIQLSGDITLGDDLDSIGNDTHGVTLTIDGAGYTIDGGYVAINLFYVDEAVVTIENLTMANSVEDAIFGYYNKLTLRNSTIRGAEDDAIHLVESDLTVVDSTLRGNLGSAVLVSSYENSGSVIIVNTTITSNGDNTDFAVGVANVTDVRLTHVTLVDNNGGLIVGDVPLTTVNNSILARNGSDCQILDDAGSSVVDFNHSLVQNDDDVNPCGIGTDPDDNLTNVDPRPTLLGDHGGPTHTILLAHGSPAIDAGDNALSLDENGVPLAHDQRGDGFDRKLGVTVDMGAAESSCADAMGVGNEIELAIAINCFNGTAVTGPHWISFVDDISLTNSPPEISNSTPGPRLYLDGDGHTLDAVNEHNIFHIGHTPDVTISNLVMANTPDDAALEIDESNVMVWNSTIRGGWNAGILLNNSDLVVSSSTLVNNSGPAIDAQSLDGLNTVTLINTTITGNGWIFPWAIKATNLQTVRLTHVTLVDNDGGLFVEGVDNVVVNNSILARNLSDCYNFNHSSTVDFNNSLVQADDPSHPCGVADDIDNNFTEHDPMLMPLGNYGGLTLTMPPYVLGGSNNFVIDTGNNDLSLDQNNIPMSIDQRGFDRKVGNFVDMGAVESEGSLICPTFPVTVDNAAELNVAVFCFGLVTTPGDYVINLGDKIDLTASTVPIDNSASGVSLTINGNSRAIDGLGNLGVRPLTIAPGTTVTLHEVLIFGGNFSGIGNSRGGGIFNEGNLTFELGAVNGNTSGEMGGGIFNTEDGVLTINQVQFFENTTVVGGGAIANEGHATITDSVFSQNKAVSQWHASGGGILNKGEMLLQNSILVSNSAEADESAFGGGISNYASLTIRDSSIITNLVESEYLAAGGGVHTEADYTDVVTDGFGAGLKVINSTLSTNSAQGGMGAGGGGLFAADIQAGTLPNPVPVTLVNTTVAGNEVTSPGDVAGSGALFQMYNPDVDLTVTIHNSILADNIINDVPDADCQESGGDAFEFVSFASLYTSADDDACGLVTGYPDANDNFVAVVSHLGPLASNGGPFPTHLPQAGSPAVDHGHNDKALDESGQPLTADQRGYEPRIHNGTVDMGAVEVGAEEPGGGGDEEAIYMTTTTSGKTKPGGLAFDNSDILKWDGEEWTLFFDGSVALQTPKKSKHNISAFWIGEDEIIMSFVQSGRKVPGITPKVDGSDLVRWDGETFTLWFDGSDVELDKKGPEGIDGLHVLPGDAASALFGEGTCVYYLIVSTTGPGAVTTYGGSQLNFGGEDVLGFCATSLGETTAGHWHMLLDGSAEGVKKNAIDSISYDDDNGILYLTTKAKFKVDTANGSHSSVYAYDIGSGTFSGPLFKAADNGLPKKVNGLQFN